VAPDAGERALAPDHLVVGHITKPHGTRGELFVLPLTDHPDAVFAPGRQLLLGDEEGALAEDAPSVVVESVRAFKRGLLVGFAGVASRDDAEPYARRYLLVPAAAVPPLDEGEVFYHELLGMSVETVDGTAVGRVREVYETDPHHLLEVAGDDGKSRLVPFAERIVRSVDREARRVIIDPPEGLLDL
jgi:16S rRNA processing protein RimM